MCRVEGVGVIGQRERLLQREPAVIPDTMQQRLGTVMCNSAKPAGPLHASPRLIRPPPPHLKKKKQSSVQEVSPNEALVVNPKAEHENITCRP